MKRRDKKKSGGRGALAKLGNRCSIPTPMGFHSKADIDKASPDVSLWYPIDPDPILRVTRCVPQNGSSIRVCGGGWWPWRVGFLAVNPTVGESCALGFGIISF